MEGRRGENEKVGMVCVRRHVNTRRHNTTERPKTHNRHIGTDHHVTVPASHPLLHQLYREQTMVPMWQFSRMPTSACHMCQYFETSIPS